MLDGEGNESDTERKGEHREEEGRRKGRERGKEDDDDLVLDADYSTSINFDDNKGYEEHEGLAVVAEGRKFAWIGIFSRGAWSIACAK